MMDVVKKRDLFKDEFRGKAEYERIRTRTGCPYDEREDGSGDMDRAIGSSKQSELQLMR